MSRDPLFKLSEAGLFCPRGAFYVDPWGAVSTAVITHAHADHAVKGSRRYFTAEPGRRVLWSRMGQHAKIEPLAFGQSVDLNGVKVSLHPAGHILGSAQVRAEYKGEVWVISGDYKVAPDATCAAFEPVRCHTFVTESTFAQPIFQWEPQQATFAKIHDWWRSNQALNRASFLYSYALCQCVCFRVDDVAARKPVTTGSRGISAFRSRRPQRAAFRDYRDWSGTYHGDTWVYRRICHRVEVTWFRRCSDEDTSLPETSQGNRTAGRRLNELRRIGDQTR